MLALTGDELGALLQGLDKPTWIVIAGLAALWLPAMFPGHWTKLKDAVLGWFQPGDDAPLFPTPPEPVDDAPLLIHQLRLLMCARSPAVRDGVNRHLDEIEQLINGTEIIVDE